MSPTTMDLASLSNPLATLEQLSSSSSQLDGLSDELEKSIRFAGVQLTQASGLLLRLPQELIAQAIVIFTRFYTGPEGGSFVVDSAKVCLSVPLYLRCTPTLTASLGCFCSVALYDGQNLCSASDPSIYLECLCIPLAQRDVLYEGACTW